MKLNNSTFLPYVYLVLGCLGVIGLLIIVAPIIHDHYTDISLLSNAIDINSMNHNENLAFINRQIIESKDRNFISTILLAILSATFCLRFIIRGITMLLAKRVEKQKYIN